MATSPPPTPTPTPTPPVASTPSFEVSVSPSQLTLANPLDPPPSSSILTTSTASIPNSAGTTSSPSFSPSVSGNLSPSSSANGSADGIQENLQPQGVSYGVLAGAIVGSTLGAAALTLVAILLFRRFRKRDPEALSKEKSSRRDLDGGGYSRHPPGYLNKGLDVPCDENPYSVVRNPSSPAVSFGRYIPEPADDNTVQCRVLNLFDMVSLHVENYYSENLSAKTMPDPQGLEQISYYNSPYLAAPVNTLLSRRGIRLQVITHCLVRTTLAAIIPGNHNASAYNDAKGSFLPCLSALYPCTLRRAPSSETRQALFAWRMLTAYLQQEDSLQHPSYTTQQRVAIESTVEAFTSAFSVYANPQHHRSERIQHLTDVMQAAANLGVWLFAQPCEFDYVWDSPTVGDNRIAISPAVVKVSDEQGQSLPAAQNIVETVLIGQS
ncbi:hypothetical protein AJ80_02009 [Polytolypa hystricis UAMH7299]|uniref:Uncharacterized protein n=1 Tax=Polytolypa hystricis (strain UAMH7299) TaxID=1447883 RepID=A0A2B7YTJ0_POLH7|nr:hypothetical protein AJ80_02009 [Polytolypa hystricis UAMH7299]